jgi:hypothetical protein
MQPVLQALQGARLIAVGKDGDHTIYHYLLKCGRVLEVVV